MHAACGLPALHRPALLSELCLPPSQLPSRATFLLCRCLQAKGGRVDMELHDDRSLLALQGPEAAAVLQVGFPPLHPLPLGACWA